MVAEFQHPIGPHTVEQWRAIDPPDDGSRIELIWGYYHVSPAPGGPHQFATGAIYRALWTAVDDAGRSEDLFPIQAVGVEITTALRTALIPDVVVLNTRPVATTFSADAVELAVEVWSPGNTSHERETKVAAYASAGVPFLWLVEPNRQRLSAFKLVGGVYRDIAVNGDPALLPGPVPVKVDLRDLFI
ncbi:Uma2 family endonuclease [Actinokineospora sp. HUAS TT18]|uniref:Uma2 family endonuclease n=1 Tax=Actinokineospora sp. HUAS TT18 TaxID=3447451 RepID=UPI003F52250B